MKTIKLMKKIDLFIIFFLFIASFSPLLILKSTSNKDFKNKIVTVKVSGALKEKINLSENKTLIIDTSHGKNILTIKDGFVTMTEADCKDKLCLNTKSISKVYQTIVCLPHEVIVEIEGEAENQSDDMIFSH